MISTKYAEWKALSHDPERMQEPINKGVRGINFDMVQRLRVYRELKGVK